MPEPTTSTQQDPTPAGSGDAGTTPPAADPNAGNTPPGAAQTGTTHEPADDIEKIVKKRLDRERKKWETEREELERRARMDEAERLKAELADRDKAIAEREAVIKRERSLRQLTGHVVEPEDALAIAERAGLVDDDGVVDLSQLLEKKSFLRPTEARPGVNAANPTASRGDAFANNPWSKRTLNLTEQARITRENPGLARQLKDAASKD